MDEEQGASCTTATHKSTGTSKPSQPYDVPVQDVCQHNCSCSNTGLACTKRCFCMADDEGCRNPHGLTYAVTLKKATKRVPLKRSC